jgi:hypothetical protein
MAVSGHGTGLDRALGEHVLVLDQAGCGPMSANAA